MKVAFMFNGFSLRGVQLNMFAYAHYNEISLKNKSIIICQTGSSGVADESPSEARDFFTERFETYELARHEIDVKLLELGMDVCVLAVSGEADNFIPTSVPTISHCVFTCGTPLGTLHTAISNTVSKQRVPVLPYMVFLAHHSGDFRSQLGIPKDALVFGRYGGWDKFDVPYVASTVLRVALNNPDVYFLFMNTKPFGAAPNIIYAQGTTDLVMKRRFINTCDAMLHAREEGETFGLACGEFALAGKPVLTSNTGDGEHRRILGDKALVYRDEAELEELLLQKDRIRKHVMTPNGYQAYTPSKVMPVFRSALAACLARAWNAEGLKTLYDDGQGMGQ